LSREGRRERRAAEQAAKKEARAALVQAKSKQPRAADGPPGKEKLPRSLGIDHEDAWHRQVVWRFGDLDMEAPPSVGDLTVADYNELHQKLGQYESQTCSQIWGEQDNGCKRYEVEGAHPNITGRLLDLERDDETAVHTLRVTGKYRVYGILRHHIFYVLWIDREHEMWPSQLKNT